MAEHAGVNDGRWAAPLLAGSGARLTPVRTGTPLAPSGSTGWAELGPRYLGHLLRAVITGPGADAEPAAARLAADLLVAMAEVGAGDDAAWALTTRPGAVAVYEVRSFVSGSLDPADQFGTADPGAAILEARDRALDDRRTVELVSRDDGGMQRCVLSQSSTGLRFRFPEFASLDAPGVGGGAIAVAVEHWRAALRPGGPASGPVVAPVVPPPAPSPSPAAIAEAVLELLVQDGRALRTYDVADVLASLIPTPADVAGLVVEQLVAHFDGVDPEGDT